MQEQKKSRKPLIIGIIAAVVILAVLLVLLLTQCTGGQGSGSSTPATEDTSTEVPTYQLYWNVDRAEYDGKSEAGMSSRMPEEDGYFHVRFFAEGEIVTLKVADRKLINAIDVQDVMGLEFDEDGIVIGVLNLDDMPLEKVGWQFYVQSAARTMIKLNSSESLNGMEVLLEDLDPNRIWDMSGKSGPIGTVDEAIDYDKIMAVQNLAGQITHVFIYERPNYMLTHEAYCEHCKETVVWSEWVKDSSMPMISGHYQLQNDVQLPGQASLPEDCKMCLDLNGHRIDGKQTGGRVIAMFNPAITLAIMDTSKEQTGVIAAHGKVDQGGVVWVRYGALYLYSGTLDASDAYTEKNGTAVDCGKDKFFYMYGGTIIGGTAKYTYNAEKNTYGAGVGGALTIGGKFVMNGGEIRDGYAEPAVIYKDGKLDSYKRGYGGNIYFSGTAEFEMNGGTIKNGRAGVGGGNFFADGACELTINGGTISGGYIMGKGANGGSVSISSKATLTMNGGSIYGGLSYNCGGNIYLNGTLHMNGGYIGGGMCYDFNTRKNKPNESSVNLFVVNGKFYMWGGTIAGGVSAIDSKKNGEQNAVVGLYGVARIDGSAVGRNLSISGSNDGVKVMVGNMYKGAKIGVNTTIGIFTEPTKQEYKQYFYSDIEGADILYYQERLALGRVSCICGKSHGETVSDSHINGCKGEVLLWSPWTATSSIPTTTGNYFLLNNVTTKAQTTIGAGNDVKVDLNGKNITLQVQTGSRDGWRLYRADNGAKLAITDTTDKPGTLQTVMPAADAEYTGGKFTVKTKVDGKEVETEYTGKEPEAKAYVKTLWEKGNFGMLLWARGGEITLHNAILDGSNLTGAQNGMLVSVGNNVVTDEETGEKTTYVGKLDMYNGTIIGGYTKSSGNVSVGAGAVMNLYGGTITGGRANTGGNVNVDGTFNMYGGTITKGLVDRSHEEVDGGMGGNVNIGYTNAKTYGVFNMYGGVISDGSVKAGKNGGGHGGNIHVYGELNATGGVIRDGVTSSAGGNISTIGANSKITLDGVQVLDGKASNGGNVSVFVRSNRGLYILGDTVISGGSVKSAKDHGGGNVSVTLWVNTMDQDQIVVIDKAVIKDGESTTNGGNIYIRNGTADHFKIDEKTGKEKQDRYKIDVNVEIKNTDISGGVCAGGTIHTRGGNLYMSRAKVTMDNAKLLNGQSIGPDVEKQYSYGGNVYIDDKAELYLKNGSAIVDGKASSLGKNWSPAGNIYISNGLVDITDSTISGGSALSDSQNIYLNYWATVNLHSGSIENTVAGGANIYMQGGTFTMDDGTVITKGITARNFSSNDNALVGTESVMGEDGKVLLDENGKEVKRYHFKYLENRPTIVINGGTVTGGSSTDSGGNIYGSASMIIEINGGTISGGTVVNIGGNIYLAGRRIDDSVTKKMLADYEEKFGETITCEELCSRLTMTGGTITGGTSTAPKEKSKNGGNVYASSGSTITMSGGTITDGQTNNMGGNVYTNGTIAVSGGTISGGKASGAQNLFIVNGSLVMSGGKIDGGISIADTSATDPYVCAVTMSGKPVITKNNGGMALPNSVDIELKGELDKGSEVWISNSTGYFSLETVKGNTANFHSIAGYDVLYDDSRLFIGREYCLCGASLVKDGKDAYWCDGNHAWQPWNGSNFMEGGYYFMEKDTTGSQIAIGVDTPAIDVVLDLAGYTYTGSNRAFRLNAGTLSITDSSAFTSENGSTGKIIAKGPSDKSHAGVFLMGGNTEINFYAGTATLELASGRSVTAGGIFNIPSTGAVNIYGGTLTGGSATKGGNIYVNAGGTLNIYGGTITKGNAVLGLHKNDTKATEILGGNIYAGSNAKVYIGPSELDTDKVATRTISDGVATGKDSANAAGGNLYLDGAQTRIYATTISGGMVQGSAFTGTDKNGKPVNYHAQGGSIHAKGGSLLLDGTTVSGGVASSGAGTGKYSYGGNLYIQSGANVTVQNSSTISGGEVTTLHTANTWHPGANIFIINSTSSLTVTDSEISGGIGRGSGSNLYITSGTVTLGKGAEVENTVAGGSANVVVAGGTLNINGAKITNGKDENGEAILCRNIDCLAEGTTILNMTDGEISGGYINGNGGNIYFEYNGDKRVQKVTFEMSGGVIANGTSTTTSGGNLYITQNTTVNMSGDALIKDGEADVAGGNIFLKGASGFEGGKLTLSGNAQITGGKNTKTGENGGSVFADYNTVITLKDNAKVLNGDSANGGGNIYSKAELHIQDNAEVSNGTSGNTAPNIFLVNGELHMSGGKIDGGVTSTETTGSTKKVYLSGKPVITKKGNGLSMKSGGTVLIEIDGTLEEGSEVWVNNTGIVSTVNANNTQNIKYVKHVAQPIHNTYCVNAEMVSANGAAAYSMSDADANKIFIGQYRCVCGGTDTHVGECGGTKLLWKPWTDGSKLPESTGNWYLTKKITVTANGESGGNCYLRNKGTTRYDIVIDLNGFDLETKVWRLFDFLSSSEMYLTLTNTGSTGKISTTAMNVHQGALVWNANTLKLYNITVDGSKLTADPDKFGMLFDVKNISLYGSTNVIGGTDNGQGDLRVTGSMKLDQSVNIDGEILVNSGAKIDMSGITDASKYLVDASGVFTIGNTITDESKFFKSDADVIFLHTGEQCAGMSYCLCGATKVGSDKHAEWCDHKTAGNHNWLPWDGVDDFPASGYYYLTSATTNTYQRIVGNGTVLDVTVDLNGCEWKGSARAVRLDNSGDRLAITDSSVYAATNSGTGKMTGALKNTTNTSEKSGVILMASGSTVDLYAGTVQMREGGLVPFGGIVQVSENGVVNVYDATLRDGKAWTGGNVHVTKNGTLNLCGKKAQVIYGQAVKTTGNGRGGNIFVNAGGTVNITNGATVAYGSVSSKDKGWAPGGNIYMDGGTLNVTGATISNGQNVTGAQTNTDGNNLYINYGAEVNLNEGALVENNANHNENILIQGGKLTLNGGKIYNAEGVTAANGIDTNTSWKDHRPDDSAAWPTIEILSGEIYGGKTNMILSGGTTVNQSGGSVHSPASRNVELKERVSVASKADPSVTVNGDAVYNMTGGKVYGGNASGNGANFYLNGTYAKLNVSGASEIYGGTANEGSGGNIYIANFTGASASIGGNAKVYDGTNTTKKTSGKPNGGNIWVGAAATLTLKDNAEVYGGDTCNGGGNFYNNGTIIVQDFAKIYNAKETASSANIFNVGGTLDIRGGQIAGGIRPHTGTVILSGAPVINKDLTTVSTKPAASIALGANVVMDVSGLTGGEVYVTADKIPVKVATNAKSSDVLNYVKSEYAYGGVVVPVAYVENDPSTGINSLYLGNPADTYCTCGASRTGAYTCECDGEARVWVQWTGYNLPTASGNYYLSGDLTPDQVLTPAKGAKIAIDLRGHDIKLDGDEKLYNMSDDDNVTIIITDSSEDAEKVGSVIKTGETTSDGGILQIRKGCTFEMYRITLDGSGLTGGTGMQGGVIAVFDGGSATMHSGTIKGANAQEGGAVFVYTNDGKPGSTFTMEEGIITDGIASASGGGNVSVGKGSTFTMNGGQILNGASATINAGGNVRVTGGGTFKMTAGVVKGGTVLDKQGDVNPADESANLYANNSTLDISGGEVWGGVAVQSVNAGSSTLKLSGKPVIDGTLNVNAETGMTAISSVAFWTAKTGNYTDTVTPSKIEITSALEAGSRIGINVSDRLFSTADATVNEASKGYFFADNGAQNIYVINDAIVADCSEFTAEDIGKLYIGQIHCVCGGLVAHGADSKLCDGKLHVWKEKASFDVLTLRDAKDTSYYWYLPSKLEGVTKATSIIPNAAGTTASNVHIWLDLNGFDLGLSGDRLLVARSGVTGATVTGCSLNIVNTSPKTQKSTITMTKTRAQGGLIWVGQGATARLFNVKIASSITDNASGPHNGGIVSIGGTGSYLYMDRVDYVGSYTTASGYNTTVVNVNTDGQIHNSTFTGAWGKEGAIYLCGTSLLLNNCTITGNNGGGVYAHRGTLTLAGSTTITGNKTTDGAANYNLKVGSEYKADGTTLIGHGYVTIADGFSGSFGLCGDADRNLITNITTWDNAVYTAGKITVDDATNQQIMIWDNGLGLTSKANIIQCACGGQVAAGLGGHQHQLLVFTPWESTTSLPTAAGSYYLSNEGKAVNLAATWTPNQGATINLDLNGHTVNAPAGYARLCSTLNKTGVTISVTDRAGGGNIKASNELKTDEGGIFWLASNATLNLFAGTLDGNGHVVSNACDKTQGTSSTAWDTGDNGTVKEKNGGLICVPAGATFNMYGGTIQGGTTGKREHTVKDAESNDLNLTPKYSAHGGNVAVGGTMNMYGGTIQNGKSDGDAGNVFVTGTLVMTGGTIQNGTAGNEGGNIRVHSNGSVTVSGDAMITGGSSTKVGGNIITAGTFTVNGGTIQNGTAGTEGGNFYIGSGTLKLQSGTVSGGIATDNGGNISLRGSGKLEITGGTVKEGKAGYGQGYLDVGGNFKSTKIRTGGNIYVNGSTAEFKLTNATVKDGGTYNKTPVATGSSEYYGEVYGGNIAVMASGAKVFEIGSGAVLSGGKAHRGCNLYIADLTENFDTCQITGGTFTGGGSSTYLGTNICLYNTADKGNDASGNENKITLTISGGEITSDVANRSNIAVGAGGGTSCQDTVVNVTGGTISGGTIVVYPMNQLHVSGTGVITNCKKQKGTSQTTYGTITGVTLEEY